MVAAAVFMGTGFTSQLLHVKGSLMMTSAAIFSTNITSYRKPERFQPLDKAIEFNHDTKRTVSGG